jgi:hypothetical protein
MRYRAAVALVAVLVAGGISRADTPVASATGAAMPAVASPATQPAQSLFDPARHMRVADVRPGMKGYGLSVFTGTKIEKFNVEVVDVVKDFNPKYDVVLIRCDDPFLEHTGAVEGMSGSPIFLFDDAGKAKLIGAFAYGWPLSKDPLAGVQPIEYMLDLPANNPPPTDDVTNQGPTLPDAHATGAMKQAATTGKHPHWSLDDVPFKPLGNPGNQPARTIVNSRRYTTMLGDQQVQLQPLATPLMATGMSARMLKQVEPLFEGTGLTLMQAGGAGPSETSNTDPKLEPGSVLGVPLLTGDLQLTAIGTCTEVIGDRMFGFGHPFNSEGPIALPMGSGGISTVVANLQASFKLGYLNRPLGTLTTDQTVGVAGTIGKVAKMIPIDLTIAYDDKSVNETYHFEAASSKKFTPLIAATALSSALTGEKDLPPDSTVDYDLDLNFENGHDVHLVNTSVSAGPLEVMNDVVLPLTASLNNPFHQESLTKLTGTIHVSNQARSGQILSVMVPKTKYEPGDTVKAFITYQPFHQEESNLPVEMALPRDLKDGTYQLTVADSTHYLEDERSIDPFKFTGDNIDDLFKVVKDVLGIRRDAIYIRLVRQADGVAVGRVAMPRLPSNLREEMMDSGRSDITPFISSTVKIVPTALVMSGSASFQITVEKHGKVETSAKPAGNAPPPTDSGKTGTGTSGSGNSGAGNAGSTNNDPAKSPG